MTDGDRTDPFESPPAGTVRDLTPPGGQPLPGPVPELIAEPSDLDPPVLDTFKRSPTRADSSRVNDAIGGRPRLNWNSVTDSGGDAPPRQQPDDSSFAFNLGNALSRIGVDDDGHRRSDRDPLAALRASLGVTTPPATEAPDPFTGSSAPTSSAPTSSAPSIELPTLERRERTSPPPAEADNLPRRNSPAAAVAPSDQIAPAPQAAPAPVPAPVAPVRPPIAAPTPSIEPDVVGASTRPYVTARKSVFDDVVSPSPALPPTVASDPTRPVAAAALAPEAAVAAPAVLPTVPTVPAAAPALAPQVYAPGADEPTQAPKQYAVVPGSPILPTLPAAVPAALPTAPFVTEQDTTQADIRAVRAAQLRAGRQRRTGKVIGRAFLIVLLLGGLVAAALTFGRSYLFPVEWDPALTELVDDIQLDRGADFQHTVGLVLQPDEEFDRTFLRLTIGDEWQARVPEWRALGLVAGDPTADGIAPDVAAGRLAVYDPAVDRIYMAESANTTLAAADLRLALEHAFDAQLGQTPITPSPAASIAGVSSTDVLAQRSVDRYLARRDAPAAQPVLPAAANVPLPIVYETLATEALGEAILIAAGADPTTATFATDVTSVLPTVLDDRSILAAAAPLQVGERSLGDATSLGTDDWSLVWGTRLPAPTVDQLVTLVVADAYQAIDRSGTTCVSGVFEVGSPDQANVLLSAMTTWVAGAPMGTASASALSETRVQLIACDPGAAAAVNAPIEAAAALVDRQLIRLAG